MENTIFGHDIVGVHATGKSLELKLLKARARMSPEGKVNAYVPI
jgi:hypothetical protein